MAPKILDPRAALDADRAKAPPTKRTARKPAGVKPQAAPAPGTDAEYEAYLDRLRADFRLFLTVIWRFLLNTDPNPIQLNMAEWLQHGPNRIVIMAFRGFSKSWITGAYALWRLLRDPQEKILVVSGNLTRAVATTNWCMQLIMEMPELAHLRPKPNQRQSAKMFDVGPALPSQSASFFALGIGGQLVGFRGTCIIPDDVETQQNSISFINREKIREAVKEFDSVLVPPTKEEERGPWYSEPAIKYLGTPHDDDSLYNHLAQRGYTLRVWPAQFPTGEQIAKYGERLAPWITKALAKEPGIVGRSTMPLRFSDEDLAKRRLSLGRSEYALQFLLDTSLADKDKYPLKVSDLMVMALDPRKGPESVSWSGDPEHRDLTLMPMGFEGDYYQKAGYDPNGPKAPYTRIVGAVDTSGRGKDETSLAIVAELNGTLFWLYLWADTGGYEMRNLVAIANACVRFGVHELRVEDNFGDGMFLALLAPVLEQAWKRYLKQQKTGPVEPGAADRGEGTALEGYKVSNQIAKEKRLLAILEPATQQHRIVVDRKVIEWDAASLKSREGEDTRHHYAWAHQFTHLTREKDSLQHDDRLDSLGGAVAAFADILGVDPGEQASKAHQDRSDEEWERIFGDSEDDENGIPVSRGGGQRAASLGITRR